MPSTLRRRQSRGNVRTSELCPCGARSLLQPAGELRSRAHSELGVDAGQVARHRPLAEEERGGDLPIGSSLGDQIRYAAFGRRQTLDAGERRLDRLARSTLQPGPPPDDAEREQRPRAAERISDRLMFLDRLLE